MDKDTIKIYLWPDGSWENEDEIDDMDWYLSSMGKSDDYTEYDVPLELEADDITELIELKALPGMIPPTEPKEPDENILAENGIIPVPEGAIVIIRHSKDIEYNAVTMLDDRLIVNAPDITVEVVKSKGGKNE